MTTQKSPTHGAVSSIVEYDPNELDREPEDRYRCRCHEWNRRLKRLHAKQHLDHVKYMLSHGGARDGPTMSLELGKRFDRTGNLPHVPDCPYRTEVIDVTLWYRFNKLKKLIIAEEVERGIDISKLPNRPVEPKRLEAAPMMKQSTLPVKKPAARTTPIPPPVYVDVQYDSEE